MLLADEKGSRIEVSATHKNLIDKLMDQPREGIVYNFQNFQVLENDDKYRITTTPWKFNFHNHTYIEEADVVISNEAYNLKTIPETQQGNVSDGDLIDVIGFLRAFGRLRDQKREFDNIKRLNFSIADAKYKVHYKVYDDIGKCSVIFFDRHATELLGQSASKIKEAMQKESGASRQTVCTESQDNVIEDDDNTLSQLITPPEANTKRKTLGNDIPVVCEDLGLA
ncbi:hypothetical protein K1719_033405 [Acacia pycnantha]|nr:hypothetical protein K1719_033405 [Acacia pycnantha]